MVQRSWNVLLDLMFNAFTSYLSSLYAFRRKSQQAEREYEKVKHQLENLEESVRDRCKKEFTGNTKPAANSQQCD